MEVEFETPEEPDADQKDRRLVVRSLIPNGITVLALCAGLTAMRFAMAGQFERAVVAIIVASILDGLDGRAARLLKGTTKFGAELDSLTDFVNFGVAPVMVLYIWSMQELGGIGWIAVLGYAICCALRLARFNVALDDPDKPEWAANYFVGVPAPAGAWLVMLPLYLSFLGLGNLNHAPVLIAAYSLFIGFLMISRIPTFSGKKMRIRLGREWVLPILLCVGLVAAMSLNFPWHTLCLIAFIYLGFIPFSLSRYRRHMAEDARLAELDMP